MEIKGKKKLINETRAHNVYENEMAGRDLPCGRRISVPSGVNDEGWQEGAAP